MKQTEDDIDTECRSKLSFQHFSEALGCQYPTVIMVLDLATTVAFPDEVTMIMSRATTFLYVIVNDCSHAGSFSPASEKSIFRPTTIEPQSSRIMRRVLRTDMKTLSRHYFCYKAIEFCHRTTFGKSYIEKKDALCDCPVCRGTS